MRKKPIITDAERGEMDRLRRNSCPYAICELGYFEALHIQNIVNNFCSKSEEFIELKTLIEEGGTSMLNACSYSPKSKSNSQNSPTEYLLFRNEKINQALQRIISQINHLSAISGGGYYVSGVIMSGSINLTLNIISI
jgi:biotin synthase-related radical SAM superfamily protein